MAKGAKQKYEKHKKDPHSGARYYYETEEWHGRVRYAATVTRGGKRWRFSAYKKGEVEDKVAEKLVELANEGVEASNLSSEERREAATARKMLGPGETILTAIEELRDCRRLLGLTDTAGEDGSLADWVKAAVKEYVEARDALGGRATVKEAAAFWALRNPDGSAVGLGKARNAFLVEAERRGVHSYTSRLGTRLEALTRYLGGGDVKRGDKRAVVSIEVREMEAFLDYHARRCKEGKVATYKDGQPRPLPFTDATRNKWIVTFKHFFSWATKKYDLSFDPAAKLDKRKLKQTAKSNEFLSADAVKKLLRAAEVVAPEYVPGVAILFFAGLRPAELIGKYEGEGEALPGLDWSSVDVDGEIVVEGKTTKTRQRRTVPVEANLKAWLDAYAPETREGPVVRNPTAWRKARAAIVSEAGVEWPQDAARHTYSTMHFGKYADRARLEANMGHTQGSGVLEANYKSLVTAAEAKRYWKIMPSAVTDN